LAGACAGLLEDGRETHDDLRGWCRQYQYQELAFHQRQGRLATVATIRLQHALAQSPWIELVGCFEEKPQSGEGWVNGGFFVLEPGVADYIESDDTVFEREPLENLARDGQLAAYRHVDFWQCMDTLRDVRLLEGLWQSGRAPWKVW
jgi:glucose-1-phosphate cytidylyltransferase